MINLLPRRHLHLSEDTTRNEENHSEGYLTSNRRRILDQREKEQPNTFKEPTISGIQLQFTNNANQSTGRKESKDTTESAPSIKAYRHKLQIDGSVTGENDSSNTGDRRDIITYTPHTERPCPIITETSAKLGKQMLSQRERQRRLWRLKNITRQNGLPIRMFAINPALQIYMDASDTG